MKLDEHFPSNAFLFFNLLTLLTKLMEASFEIVDPNLELIETTLVVGDCWKKKTGFGVPHEARG